MHFRAFNFRTSQAVRKYFSDEIFAIYGMFLCNVMFVHKIIFSTYRLNMREKGTMMLTIQISPVLQRSVMTMMRLVKLMAVVLRMIVDQTLLSNLTAQTRRQFILVITLLTFCVCTCTYQ